MVRQFTDGNRPALIVCSNIKLTYMHHFRIKNKRAPHIIIILAVLLLMYIVFWAFFLKEEPLEIDTTAVIIMSAVGGIGSVCLFMAIKIMIRNPDVLLMNEKGFEYNPGGVSSGFMEWTNVAEIKYVDVRTTHGQLNGPVWERTLAVTLKDPSLYTNQFNPLMRGLMHLNKKMYEGDIFFRLSSFGKQAEEVHKLMMQYWEASKSGTASIHTQ